MFYVCNQWFDISCANLYVYIYMVVKLMRVKKLSEKT